MRMLPAVTPGEPRSPTTKRVGAKNAAKKTDLAACNTLESQPVRQFFKALGLSAGCTDESTRSQDSRAPHF